MFTMGTFQLERPLKGSKLKFERRNVPAESGSFPVILLTVLSKNTAFGKRLCKKYSLVQYITTRLQGPKDPVLPILVYIYSYLN